MNGKAIGSIKHLRQGQGTKAKQNKLHNVKVYISNPWNNSTNGKIRRLTIKGQTARNPIGHNLVKDTKPGLILF